MNYRRLRGTEDIFEPEVGLWSNVEALAREIFELYGYKEIRTPLIEYTELFKRSIGENTDIVEKEIFQFQDKSQRSISLRPEATASIVRAYIENSLYQMSGIRKLYYSGAMFRAERPQKGRKRQFHQVGVEAIGSLYPEIDAEVILLAQRLFDILKVKDCSLEINTLGCKRDKKRISDYLKDEIKGSLKELCSSCKDRYSRNIFRVLDCKNPACRERITGLNKEMLGVLNINYHENRYLVRGLDYYTRTVFEFSHKGLGSQNTIAAGGRYDNLVEDIGAASSGAIGFALVLERLIMVVGDDLNSFKSLDIFVVLQSRNLVNKALALVCQLRDNGISADMDYEGRSLKAQMRLANEKESKLVLILGEQEDREGVYSLKDMTTHKQQRVNKEDLLSTVKGGLNC
jgi:histidyl-tRNA synthetase